MALTVCVCVLAGFLTEENLLRIIFEKVHARIGPAALLEVDEVLRLLDELILLIAAVARRAGHVEILLVAVPLSLAARVLRVTHFRLG